MGSTELIANLFRISQTEEKLRKTVSKKKLDKEINTLTKSIYKCAGEEFNINSPKQLSEILFNKLGLDYDRKKGEKLSTGVEVLEKLIDKHEIIQIIK